MQIWIFNGDILELKLWYKYPSTQRHNPDCDTEKSSQSVRFNIVLIFNSLSMWSKGNEVHKLTPVKAIIGAMPGSDY